MQNKWLWQGRSVCVAGVLLVCSHGAIAAKLTQLEGAPEGNLTSNSEGYISAHGPRYDGYGHLLGDSGLNIGERILSDPPPYDAADLFVFANCAVADKTYYPLLTNLAELRGSMGSRLTLSDPGGGGEFETKGSRSDSTLFVNVADLTIYGNFVLQAHPQAWAHNTSSWIGPDDNETLEVSATLSASTHNSTNDFLYFRIDPVFNEQVGDLVPVILSHYNSGVENINHDGNTNYIGSAAVSSIFTINGQPVVADDEPINAAVGDIIGAQFSVTLTFQGGGVIQEPSYPWNQYLVMAAANVFAKATIAIEPTVGLSQDNPLMPLSVDPTTLAYTFEEFALGDSGLGIETPIWFDPDVALGYNFTVVGAGVVELSLPDLLWGASTPVLVWYDIGSGRVFLVDEEGNPCQYPSYPVEFPQAVNSFGITGIDPALGLDPENPAAFPVGLRFNGPSSGVQVTMTPVLTNEPPLIPDTVPVDLEIVPGGVSLTLSWLGEVGVNYIIQTNMDLVHGPWGTAALVQGSGDSLVWTNGLIGLQGFFRVLTE